MNKKEFINKLAQTNPATKKDNEHFLNSFIEVVTDALANNKEINLIGFGKFYTNHRPQTKGRNPRTGKEITINAYNSPKFKPGKALKDCCN